MNANGIISLTETSWASKMFHAKIIPAPRVALARDAWGILFWRCTMSRRNMTKAEKQAEARQLEAMKLRGFVYLMYAGDGYYKIGITKDVQHRLVELNYFPMVKVELVHCFHYSDARIAEGFLHERYYNKRIKFEWFQLDTKDVEWIKTLRDDDPRIKRGAREALWRLWKRQDQERQKGRK